MGNMHEIDAISEGRHAPAGPSEHLTPRQLEVLALLCEGLPNKLIARRLDISNATVKIHVGHILRVLNVASRLQAVIAARSLGLAPGSGGIAPAWRDITPRYPGVLRLLLGEDGGSPVPAADSEWSLVAATG